MGKASRKKLFSNPILHLLLIAIIGLLAYSNTFNVPFQFDDTDDIAKNNKLRDLDRFWPPAGSRWFGFLTFALNFNLNGLNTTGYHIFNLSVHILNAILVYWFVVLTLRIHDTRYTIKNMHHASCIVHHESGQADSPIHPFMVRQAHHDTSVTLSLSKGTYLPLFVALIFVSHPIQTQAVTYIVQRLAALATLFYLLSLVMGGLRPRRVLIPSPLRL